MLTITDDQLRLLARYEDTLGPMLLTLAFPAGFDERGPVEIETREGWERCEAGAGAREAYGDVPMQGYTRPGSGIVLTLARVDGRVCAHAQGEGWEIDADGPYGGWMQTADRARSTVTAGAYAHIRAEAPWHFASGGDPVPADHEPRIYGPSGPMRMEGGMLVTVEAFVPSMGEPALDTPLWLRPDYDWETAVAADPTSTLSRIHLLAKPLDIVWEGFETPRVLHEMMERIEERLGIETTDPEIGGHRLQIGARVTAAEAAAVGRTS